MLCRHCCCSASCLAALVASCVLLGTITAADPTIDYHAVRRQARPPRHGVYEGEAMEREGNARPQKMTSYAGKWSGDHHLLWDGVIGDATTVRFHVHAASTYRLSLQLTKAPDYGAFHVLLDGKPIDGEFDLYDPRVALAPLSELGEFELSKGVHELTFELTSANPNARKFRNKGYLLGLDYIKLVNVAPPPPAEEKRERPTVEPLTFAELRPVLAKYCFRCHGDAKAQANVQLQRPTDKDELMSEIDMVNGLAEVLVAGTMPPEDEPQPPEELRERLIATFDGWITEYLRTNSTLRPVVMRRMNRFEYSNAVRDLLNLRGDIYPLPEKTIRADQPYFDPASGYFPPSVRVGNRTLGKFQVERQILTGVVPFAIDPQAEHGFNNRGEELSLSPILLESFLKLGESIVNSPQFAGYCRNYASLFEADERSDAVELARRRLQPFLTRAFRASVDDETLDRYVSFFAADYATSQSFATSMKKVVSAVLASPRFLYVLETKVEASEKQLVDDFELATRLSFFLWSSLPDDELLKLAASSTLHKPAVLEAQVRRMLEDPRSKALSNNFARQWLRLDQLITAVPDERRFKAYYSRIGCEQWKFGLQMMIEPLLLFESVVVEDRSIMLLVDSNYSYRSDELQTWYQPGPPFGNRGSRNRFNTFQQDFKRRDLTTRREGGVITTAAVMTMTSAPLRTSPITRGAWVATVIFNRPPSPPPDVVPEIEADDAEIEAQGLTLRQRLQQHQVNQACASCHAKIDPLGFVLENYNAVGRWRESYRSGLEIDSSGKFGDMTFDDVEEFKDELLARPELFMTAFTEHMLSYAIGRELDFTDQPAVERIVNQVSADHGRFSTLVVEIAKSYPFLYKTNQAQSADDTSEPNE